MKFKVKVPGKLIVAGDYAVLEQGHSGIVVAVNRYVTVTIEENHQNLISIPYLNIHNLQWEVVEGAINFNKKDNRLNYLENSFKIATKYLAEANIELLPFRLTINSDLYDKSSRKKYGLGSSAAVVVGIITAILNFHLTINKMPNTEELFKLAAISHLKTQKGGSGIDIAASTFGGWLEYSTYDSEYISQQLQLNQPLTKLVKMKWPNLVINKLTVNFDPYFCVGWTGEPISTRLMLKRLAKFKVTEFAEYDNFLRLSGQAIEQLKRALLENDRNKLIAAILTNRHALKVLGQKANVPIETAKLHQLCNIAEIYGGGKTSGAGGGDCGIAFVKEANLVEQIYLQWTKVGITPLYLKIANPGIIVTKLN